MVFFYLFTISTRGRIQNNWMIMSTGDNFAATEEKKKKKKVGLVQEGALARLQ